MKTVVVTGAAGFIGSHLVEALLRTLSAARVVGCDNFDPFYDAAQKKQNLAAIEATHAAHPEVSWQFIEGGFTDPRLNQVFKESAPGDVVMVHLAALAGVRPSLERAADYAQVNVRDTMQLFDQFAAACHRRLVFASSSSVYGELSQGPFDEAMRVDKPISPYAATKRAGEVMLYTFHHLHQLRAIALRFFTVYGPRQRPDLAISKFIRAALDGEPISIHGDGSATRDFTYVDDIVMGVLGAIDWSGAEESPAFEIVNLGAGNPHRLDDVISEIERAVGVTLQKSYGAKQPGDVSLTHANIEKARALLRYAPKVSLQNGIAEQVRWLRGQKDPHQS